MQPSSSLPMKFLANKMNSSDDARFFHHRKRQQRHSVHHFGWCRATPKSIIHVTYVFLSPTSNLTASLQRQIQQWNMNTRLRRLAGSSSVAADMLRCRWPSSSGATQSASSLVICHFPWQVIIHHASAAQRYYSDVLRILHSWWIVILFWSPWSPFFASHNTKTLPQRAIFSCCGLRPFWGRKRREKRRRKVWPACASECIKRMQRMSPFYLNNVRIIMSINAWSISYELYF